MERHLNISDVPEVARRRSRPPVINSVGDVVGELVVSLPGAGAGPNRSPQTRDQVVTADDLGGVDAERRRRVCQPDVVRDFSTLGVLEIRPLDDGVAHGSRPCARGPRLS